MPLVIAMAIVLIIEHFLQWRWVPGYCVTGLRLFNERIPAPAAARARLVLNSLERDVAPLADIDLVFHALPDGRIAFRESFFPNFSKAFRRYYPVMHGLVEVDARRNEIRVVGICNWHALIVPLILLVGVAINPNAYPMLFLPLVFIIGYVIQRKAYRCVVEAVRTQLDGNTVMDQLIKASARR